MLTNIAISEAYNLAMVFDTPTDQEPPPGLALQTIDIPPDDIKELVDNLIFEGYNVIVTPAVVLKCGLKESDFKQHVKDGESGTKMGSIDDITGILMELERRRLES